MKYFHLKGVLSETKNQNLRRNPAIRGGAIKLLKKWIKLMKPIDAFL
jgi:hypothetical protein